MTTEIINGRISHTMLGIEDHGIFSSMVTIEIPGGGCGFGGYSFGTKATKSAWTNAYILGLLAAVGVDSWEKLRGQLVRIEIHGMRIKRIGHIMENRWFDPKALAAEMGLDQ